MADESITEKFSILDLIDRSAEKARAAPARPVPPPGETRAEAEPEAAGVDDIPALPAAGDAYRAYSRLASRPLACLFFLPRTMLPSGFLYHALERVWMEAGERPGTAPRLVARFGGSEVTDVVMEGRNLLPLCMAIGRMAVAWIRELPAHEPANDDAVTIIRSITLRPVES